MYVPGHVLISVFIKLNKVYLGLFFFFLGKIVVKPQRQSSEDPFKKLK